MEEIQEEEKGHAGRRFQYEDGRRRRTDRIRRGKRRREKKIKGQGNKQRRKNIDKQMQGKRLDDFNSSYGKEEEWTYIGEQGASVIDYIITNDKAIKEVKMVGEGNRTESDHMLIEVELGMERKRGKKSDMIIKEKNAQTKEEVMS